MHLFLLKTKGLERKQMGRLVGAQWRWQRGEARGLILNKCLEANFWPTPPCLTTGANFWHVPSFQRFLDAGVRTTSPQSEPAFNKRSILSLCALHLMCKHLDRLPIIFQELEYLQSSQKSGVVFHQINSRNQCTVYRPPQIVAIDSVFIYQW